MVCLHLSVFAAFIAGILDLSQVLLRSGDNAQPDVQWSYIAGLTTSREIFLALSIGLRFAFFWYFVAQPPTGETDASSDKKKLHNGSWEKWGITGMLLKWLLALLCAAIVLLQILYRTVDTLENFGPVYEVESTIEIVASACFILKILLNSYLVVITSPQGSLRWKPLLDYIPFIVALLLNATFGVGNMIHCMCILSLRCIYLDVRYSLVLRDHTRTTASSN